MTGDETAKDFNRVLDGVVIALALMSLVMIAYDLNVMSLGRRLVAETQAWLKEQTWRPVPPKKEDP